MLSIESMIWAGIQGESVDEKAQWEPLFRDGLGYKLMVAISLSTLAQNTSGEFLLAWVAIHKESQCSALTDKICETQMIYAAFNTRVGQRACWMTHQRKNIPVQSQTCKHFQYTCLHWVCVQTLMHAHANTHAYAHASLIQGITALRSMCTHHYSLLSVCRVTQTEQLPKDTMNNTWYFCVFQ